MGKYEAVIGLEVHAQLLTKSKLFCGDASSFGESPNTRVSNVSLAHPGSLPVLNKEALVLAVRLGLALNCHINRHNYFARKHYFYPDLPKGFQVSQHSAPICSGGFLAIETVAGKKNILLDRIHAEEDAGKSLHEVFDQYTAIDLNRAGTPLLEIVTKPCLCNPEEAYAYLTALRRLVRQLEVCDGNMEEGSMRCDANISIRLQGEAKLGIRVEVKNLNSIRNVKKAIDLEVARLISISESGERIQQETRSYDADSDTTFSLRSKEEADDYRYFPEPDLPPLHLTEEFINSIAATMPALPAALQEKFVKQFRLSEYDAALLSSDKGEAELFERTSALTKNHKLTANWINGPMRTWCNEHRVELCQFPLSPEQVAKLILFTAENSIHFNTAAGRLLPAVLKDPGADLRALCEEMELMPETDDAVLENWIHTTLSSMPDKVAAFRAGKKNLLGLFAGEVKKLSSGRADMKAVNNLLIKKLENNQS